MNFSKVSYSFLLVVLMILLAFASGQAQTVLVSDDFENYAAGSSLAGQGGWYQDAECTARIILSGSTPLGTIAVDGSIRTGTGRYDATSIGIVLHPLSGPLNANGLSVFSLDAYASNSRRSHACGAHLAPADRSFGIGWFAYWCDNHSAKWGFRSGAGGDDFFGGFDEPVKLETVIDGENGTVYGRLTHSNGVYETPHFPITTAVINSLAAIYIYEDYRDFSYLGADFDNILVSTTPSATSPTITDLSAEPGFLWPPNHKMVPVTINAAAEGGWGSLSWEILTVSCNEPIIPGIDWAVAGPLQVYLQATRLGKGDGRTYTITVQCTDEAGNTDTKITTVTVPHDKR